MKTAIALTAFVSLAVADWSYTFTGPSGAWTSVCTGGVSASNYTTTASTHTATEWTFSTSYTATYSSGSSTWGVPTEVAYSAGPSWTSMIPAPTNATSIASSVAASTTVAPSSAVPVASVTSSAPQSTFTGAASNNKAFGGAAIAAGALALML